MLKAEISFKDNTAGVSSSIANFINRAVGKSILVMERNIKQNTPVKHGTLKRSITSKMTGFGQGVVFTNPIQDGKEVRYAIYVEYGTKYIAPRAMFRKGVAQSQDQIKDIFASEAKNVVK